MKDFRGVFTVGLLVFVFLLVTKADIEAPPMPTTTNTQAPTATTAPEGAQEELPSSIDVTYDEIYSELPQPSKPGYNFIGWFLEREADGNGTGKQITENSDIKITSTTYVYARWEPKNYTVSFNSNGGTPCGDIKVDYDRKYGYYSALPEPTKEGHVFAGWYLTENGSETEITNDTRVQILADTTLNAKWEPGEE